MKIIFLDIDGVLNSLRSCMAFGDYPYPGRNYHKFDDVAIGLVKDIIKATDAKVFLSSTWRLTLSEREQKQLSRRFDFPIFGLTPDLSRKKRGYEIQTILDEYNPTHYVILDDSFDMLDSQLSNFVKVDYNNGLSYENYKRALKLLGHEENNIVVVGQRKY